MNIETVLPKDLTDFLIADSQLTYDTTTCEAGRVAIRPLSHLHVQLFPTDPQGDQISNHDPHRGELGCYLVEAVDLVATAQHYDPTGLLLWLPREGQFGTWDSSRPWISVFDKSVTWTDIAAEPARFINAQWEGAYPDSAPTTPLIPWPRYTYHPTQMYHAVSPR